MIIPLNKLCIIILIMAFMPKAPGEIGSLSIDGKTRVTWYSEPYDHKCLLDCTHELVEPTTRGDVAIKNKTCSVECLGQTTQQQRFRSENFKRVQVISQTNAVSECLVGVLVEDIFCAKVSLHFSGVRKLEIENSHQCQRRNYRYYLPHSKCDESSEKEEGEESCEAACVHDDDTEHVVGQTTSRISVDIGRVRAKYRVCYDGMVSESYRLAQRTGNLRRGRYWHFCRAELTPCSTCFRWGNWTTSTSCSRSCGSLGKVAFHRHCEILESQETTERSKTFKPVADAYCKAYYGGATIKTESCGTDIPCPEWSQWGAWSGCPDDTETTTESVSTGVKIGCKSKRRKRNSKLETDGYVLTSSTTMPSTSGEETSTSTRDNVVSSPPPSGMTINDNKFDQLHGKMPSTLKGFPNFITESRRRKCIFYFPYNSFCSGNSTQHRRCQSKAGADGDTNMGKESATQKESTILEEDCEESHTESGVRGLTKHTTVPTGKETASSKFKTTSEAGTTYVPVDTVQESHERINITRAPGLKPVKTTPPKRPNSNFTLPDDGFTSVLTDYAPALIAALLVFIVLLLIALIAVCGTRIMQKNRNTAYDVTSPSFSAGTVGSIPSGLVHSFSHTLGLRSGSGTFGRSVSTINGVGVLNNDAVSSRGSCKSVTSATSGVAGKASAAQQQKRNGPQPQQTTACKVALAKNSPHTRAPLQTAGSKTNNKYTTTAMAPRKPSSSSLLSTSSVTGTPVPIVPAKSCSLQPLPPIPPSQAPYPPATEDTSAFRRGAGRSSSLTPMEQENKARLSRNQKRCESVGGRVGGKHYTFSRESVQKLVQNHHAAEQASGNAWTTRAKHFNNSSDRGRRNLQGAEQSTSHPYCKHTCDGMACGSVHGARDAGASTENEYWSVSRREYLDSGTESSDGRATASHGGPRKRGRKVLASKKARKNTAEDIPMAEMPETIVSRSKHDTKKWFGGNAEVEMVDNVLYAVTTNASTYTSTAECTAEDDDDDGEDRKEYNMLDFSSSGEGSVRSHLGSCGENLERPNQEKLWAARPEIGAQFYNKIELEESSKSSDASTTNDDDYDHLCDQFGAPYITRPKTKFPGIMTSLHQLRQYSFEVDGNQQRKEDPHNYESIEFDEDEDIREDPVTTKTDVTAHDANDVGGLTCPERMKHGHKYVNTHRCVDKAEDLTLT